jgi:hypothetical protein
VTITCLCHNFAGAVVDDAQADFWFYVGGVCMAAYEQENDGRYDFIHDVFPIFDIAISNPNMPA